MQSLIIFCGWSGESRVKYYTEMKIYGRPTDDLEWKLGRPAVILGRQDARMTS